MQRFSCSLIMKMEFSEELAVTVAEQGIDQSLLRLKAKICQFSDSDPLLVLVMDISDDNSVRYVNTGNYGLPPGVLGSLPWPGGAPAAAGAAPAGVWKNS
jgi:hypothetical protein